MPRKRRTLPLQHMRCLQIFDMQKTEAAIFGRCQLQALSINGAETCRAYSIGLANEKPHKIEQRSQRSTKLARPLHNPVQTMSAAMFVQRLFDTLTGVIHEPTQSSLDL